MASNEAGSSTPTSDAEIEGRADLLVPALFISAAAVILALQDPINIRFEPRLLETLAITLLGVALVGWATFRQNLPLFFAGVAVLLTIITVGVITQPSQLNVPVVAIWPLRAALVLLVAGSWAFLMSPPRWLRRAMLAAIIPSFLALLLWGGPATAAQLFGWNVLGTTFPLPARNFSPFWLTVDSHGTLYATDVRGGLIWVFDSSGSPKGTLRPGRAPAVPTPGPGIIPTGFEEEINLTGAALIPTATPPPGVAPSNGYLPNFEFCGITTDAKDNLYTVDIVDPTGYKILRFDREGMITARWPVPEGYAPTSGCLAADAEHIYLGAVDNKVYVLDFEGKEQKQIRLQFQPFGISPKGKGMLEIISPGVLSEVDVATNSIVTATLPASSGDWQIPMLALQNGDVLVTNHQESKLARIDPKSRKLLGEIGGPGSLPGQFQEVGGLAQDAAGRIYVSDWQHRVIQRFTAEGKIDAVWWATLGTPDNGQGEND